MLLYRYSQVGDIVVIKIAVLSNDSCYVNNIRSKCFKNNFAVEQLNSTMDLINYLIDEKSGIVLLDMKRPSKIISFIHEKILKNNIVDFKFVSMTDFSKCYIAICYLYYSIYDL
jgi:FixJ family two-component response regulator